MIVSVNEVETTCYRAALGVGLAPGVAEDAAAAAGRLVMANAGSLPLLLEALRGAEREPSLVPFVRSPDGWKPAREKLPALIAGPALSDLVSAGEAVDSHFQADVPEVLQACLAGGSGNESDEISVDAVVWSEIQKLAARTYVKSSERSRLKGAGAGMRDED